MSDIEAFIRQHAGWVLKKLDEFRNRTGTRHLPVREGTRVPVLDGETTIRIIAGNNRAYWSEEALWLAARPDADLVRLTRRALQRRALEYFRPRLTAAAVQIDKPPPRLSLSSARSRWGSCSATSGIRLNWRLIHLPAALVDYVIAHEAAHLVEMNHSTRFWRIVDKLHPGWESARAQLRQAGSALPLI